MAISTEAHVTSVSFNANFIKDLTGTNQPIDKVLEDSAHELIDRAKAAFNRQVQHTKPVTDPPYAESFYVRRDEVSKGWIAGNDDPESVLVEFGTHPGGGQTRTLGYRPFGRAIDEMS